MQRVIARLSNINLNREQEPEYRPIDTENAVFSWGDRALEHTEYEFIYPVQYTPEVWQFLIEEVDPPFDDSFHPMWLDNGKMLVHTTFDSQGTEIILVRTNRGIGNDVALERLRQLGIDNPIPYKLI